MAERPAVGTKLYYSIGEVAERAGLSLDEARRIWLDALQQAPDDPLLIRTLERLDVDLAR